MYLLLDVFFLCQKVFFSAIFLIFIQKQYLFDSSILLQKFCVTFSMNNFGRKFCYFDDVIKYYDSINIIHRDIKEIYLVFPNQT